AASRLNGAPARQCARAGTARAIVATPRQSSAGLKQYPLPAFPCCPTAQAGTQKKARTSVWRSPGLFESGAGDESRTRDLNLGKVALYQLSYSRVAGAVKTLGRSAKTGIIAVFKAVCKRICGLPLICGLLSSAAPFYMPDSSRALPATLVPAAQDLTSLNTLGLASHAPAFVRLRSPSQLEALSTLASRHRGLLVLGGGSNLVLPPQVDSLVAHVALRGVRLLDARSDAWIVEAGAGENWHGFVSACVANGWDGLEHLALIPGPVGAAPWSGARWGPRRCRTSAPTASSWPIAAWA